MSGALTRWGAVGAAALALVALPVAAEASAKGILDIDHPGLAVKMSLRGSHGYRIEIENAGGRVRLTASKGELKATYEVPGRVTRHGLRANFGRLGRVAVRFRRIGEPRASKPFPFFQCRGRDPIHERGRFGGTIGFRGEEGFTTVSARSAKGSVVHRFERHCGLPGGRGHRHPGARAAAKEPETSFLGTALRVEDKEPGRTVSFGAFSAESKRGRERSLFLSFVTAETSERRGRMTVEKTALTEGDEGSLLASSFGVRPVTATISLPRPFAGTGSYREEVGAPSSWTGTLHVRLPGADVPLTGPGFSATLCRSRSLEKSDDCLDQATGRSVPGPLPGS